MLFALFFSCYAPLIAQADEHADTIAWRKIAKPAEVDAAFAEAREAGKPVFLYWGAVWCPLCNQIKATIFNRQEFIARTKFFVPVYIDGDSPGAQKLGERFKVTGYPTTILFKPDGSEIIRLPGEVDVTRYVQLLDTGMNGGRPARETLTDALGGRPLSAGDWRLLAYYSWDEDEQQLIAKNQRVVTLTRLAAACPPEQRESAARLQLTAIISAAGEPNTEATGSAAAYDQVMSILGDSSVAHQNFDLLTDSATDIVTYLSAAKSAQRASIQAAWNKRLDELEADTSFSTTDRLDIIAARLLLAKLDQEGPLPASLVSKIRAESARADRETSNGYERQSVINAAAYILAEAGLLDESDTLLKAELKRSHSPYYFMLDLAANARKRNDNASAIDWYAQAYAAAKGPATRLQWGTTYVRGLIDLAPEDEVRIEQAANSVIAELGATPSAFYERNSRAVEKLHGKLAEWNKDQKHAAVVSRMDAQLSAICTKLPAGGDERAVCERILASKT